jgi:hypothetical protein
VETAAVPHRHPIRLVVTDDLARSRLTVFFRLLLALPHLLWAGLFGVGAAAAAFINWWAVLFTGRTPTGLHNFLAGYVRYATHVEGYLFLAANPFPSFYLGDVVKPYPVDVEIDPPARQRRLTVLLRLFLALPAILISIALTGGIGGYAGTGYYRAGAGVAGTAALLLWFAGLARARVPRGLRDLTAWGIGYGAQTAGYFFLLTDRYPTSDPIAHVPPLPGEDAMPEQPALAIVRDDLRRSRLTVFFRLPLAVPHLVWSLLWTAAAVVAAIAGWFAALVIGRLPAVLGRFLSAYVRYGAHVTAFIYLVANPFPGFTGKPGSYPIDLELAPPGAQRRLTIAFRLLLAVPTLLIAGAANNVLTIVALLGWFASLVLGRLPEGLRNAGAWAVGYTGQAWTYVWLLSGRYPHSSPNAVAWRA